MENPEPIKLDSIKPDPLNLEAMSNERLLLLFVYESQFANPDRAQLQALLDELGRRTAQPDLRPRFEYLTVTIDGDGTFSYAGSDWHDISDLGREGWELCAATMFGDRGTGFFKRRL